MAEYRLDTENEFEEGTPIVIKGEKLILYQSR